ncbi:MAG: beta-lactamase family protein [Hyphomicrobiales bacterium]|nr:beta-lactamase family protein [Hyphomicrobiales bacterium]
MRPYIPMWRLVQPAWLHALSSLALAAGLGLALSTGMAQAGDCGADSVSIAGDCVGLDAVSGKIRTIVTDAMERDDLTAVIVNIRIGDNEILREAYGDSMVGVPATADMHFRNGAVAIAYMSTVLLRLQEQGVLKLDDTLANWFPDYPKAEDITLEMLIASTSGYADFVNLDILPLYEDPFRQYTPDELIDMGLSQPMVCDPGSCFAYAHTNYVILGEVMRRAAGKPVEDLIEEFVLAPLGLENTRSESTAVIQRPVLHAFTAERGFFEDSTYWNPSWTLARGAVMTTDIDDLAVSAAAIGEGTLLSAESHALQVGAPADPLPPFTDTTFYAMGALITNGWVAQTPSFAGYAAAMAYLPSREITVAIASTNGRDTPDSPRPTDTILRAVGEVLASDQVPAVGRG